MAALEAASGVPVLGMESPRGLNDPSLGAFAEVLAQADCLVLVGKPLDFTLKFGEAPAVAPACRFVVIDPDPALVARVDPAPPRRLGRGRCAGRPSRPWPSAARASDAARRPRRDGLAGRRAGGGGVPARRTGTTGAVPRAASIRWSCAAASPPSSTGIPAAR